MITCKDVSRLAADYCEGRLGWRGRLAVRAHLFLCVNCRRYVAQLGATMALIRDRRWAGTDAAAEDRLAGLFRGFGEDGGRPPFTCT